MMIDSFEVSEALTIITVVRNDRRALALTRASLEAQSNLSFKWLVIDGRSTDDTLETLEAPLPFHAEVFSEEDRGIYDAMNKGLQRATGAGIIYLNAGDTLADDSVVERVLGDLPLMHDPEVAGFFGRTIIVRGTTTQISHPKTSPEWIRGAMPAIHQSIVFNRHLHQSFPYDLKYPVSADYGVVAAMYMAGHRFVRRNYTIAVRDGNESGTSSRQWKRVVSDTWKIQRDIVQAGLIERSLWASRRAGQRALTLLMDRGLVSPNIVQALRGR